MSCKCRVCGSELKDCVVTLNKMPLTDDFIDTGNLVRQEYLRDINIYQCDECGIVQNPEDFDHESYYQDYQYSSGHSEFTRNFMAAYAKSTFDAFEMHNCRKAESVIEVGSGDGQQLKQFLSLGATRLVGIEPSDYLAKIANEHGIDTEVSLFGADTPSKIDTKFDVCLSSYTFDHVRNPIEYLITAHNMLVDGGILAIEIHDLGKIIERTEYCLFEHEHTIYLRELDIAFLLEECGFTLVSINPIEQSVTRGNSLIAIAKKSGTPKMQFKSRLDKAMGLDTLQNRINTTIERISAWTKKIPDGAKLVGFGAGGRGVMTLAATKNSARFDALLDSNYRSHQLLTPKTRLPIVGPAEWPSFSNSYCLVFSFGYFDEICDQLVQVGFARDRIVSLLDFYPSE